ncbi:MAG: DUF6056 family protein [Bacteroidia bacterium]
MKYIALFALLLIPYIILCYFAQPIADDLTYTVKTLHRGYLPAQLQDYFFWNGRYASNVLVLANPLIWGSLTCYRLAALALILLTPLSFYFFLSAWLGKSLSPRQKLLGALAFSALYFCIMPDLSEGIYWFTGSVTYQFGNIVAITYIGLATLYVQKRYIINGIFHASLCFLMLLIAIGFNEVLTLMLIVGHFIIYPLFRKDAELRPILAWMCVFSLLFSLIMILAPGNVQRGGYFTGNYQIIHPLWMSALQVIRFFAKWVSSPALLLASLLFIPIGQKLYKESPIFRKLAALKLWQAFAILCIIIFLCVFPPYWGTGILGQHRTLNTACFFFIIAWFLFIFIAFKQYDFRLTTAHLRLITFLFIACLLLTGNSGRALIDLGNGKVSRFANEMDDRMTVLETAQKQQAKTVSLPTIQDRPSGIFVIDISDNPNNGINKSYAEYYGIEKVIKN